MPQTVYNLDQTAAIIGQIVQRETMSGRYSCSEDIPFGRVVELNAGQWRLPQGSTLGKVLGVAPYNPAYIPSDRTAAAGVYKSGDSFTALREGQVWIEQDGGGTPDAAQGQINVDHSTTTATNRGKVTCSATSSTAGAEIAALPGSEVVKEDAGQTMVLCHVRFVANQGG